MVLRHFVLVLSLVIGIWADSTKLKSEIVYDDEVIAFTEPSLTAYRQYKDIIIHDEKKFYSRNVFTDPNHLWPNGRVPFILDENIPAFTIVEILAAMQEIETSCYSGGKNCITFVPWTNENDYIHISWTSGTQGSTSIGRAGGKQDLTINSAGGRGHDDNLYIFMLALGLIPEVMRSDRDTYLNINITNAVSTDPFRVLTGQGTSTFGQSFDFDSLLLAGPYLYARDPSRPVTSARVDGHVMGQRVSMSAGDVTLLQHAYHCAVDSSHVMDILGTMPIECHFHTDTCSLIQDTNDDFNWVVQAGPTTTAGTGPTADLSSGSGKFALAEARNHHNMKARLISQQLPAGQYCLRANFHMYGQDVGTLKITAIASGTTNGADILNQSGALGNSWYHSYLNIDSKAPFTIQFEATMGAGDQGDIGLDDVYVYNGKCIEWN